MQRAHSGYANDNQLAQPPSKNGSRTRQDSKKYNQLPRAAYPIRVKKSLLSPANKLAPLPHLFICLSPIPNELLEGQIRECWKTLEVIRLKHSSPYHGTIAFSSDPTVLMWESHSKYLALKLLVRNARFVHVQKFSVLSDAQISTLAIRNYDAPSFTKNELMLESHEQYIHWLTTGRKGQRPTIHFPPATQWSKTIYPTETYAGE